MNKTIIININGIVFHIEEDAYEILKQYMTDVKRHFLDSEDSFEITSDIENRIAEMFNEILAREAKQVIVGQDVNAVIEQMGTVEDFEHAEDDTQPIKNAGTFTYKTASRRLFRDPDDHLVAGVCAGIANYFDIPTLWVRLIFGLSFAVFGSGFFLYLVLWLVIPRAVSRADRMAMKGEKLDLQGFKKNFEDEINTVRGHVTDFGRDAKPFVYKSRDFISDFFDHLGAFLGGTGKVLLKLLGVFILLTCLGFGIALIVGMIAFFAFGNMGIIHIFPFNIVDKQYNALFFGSAFLLLALPLLTIALLTTRMVFNRESFTKSSGFTILILWLGSLCMVIYFSAEVAADFRSSAGFSQTVSIKPTVNNTYYLKLNQARYISSEDSIRLNIKDHFGGKVILDADDDNDDMDVNTTPRNMHISIERSDVTQPVLEEQFTARGHSYADALTNARYTSYQFIQVDSVLKFDRHLQKQINHPWRDQEVKLVLRVPLNAVLVIDEKMNNYLNNIDIYQCERDNKVDEDRSITSAKFIMTASGLQCKIDTLVTAPVKPKL